MTLATFPVLPGLAWSVTRAPSFDTLVRTLPSLRDVSASLYATPRLKFEAPYEFLRDGASYAELQALAGFFDQMGGSYERFLVKDPRDYQLTDAAIGTTDGAITTFIVARNTGPSFYEAVGYVVPTSPTPVVKLNGSTVSTSLYDLVAPNLIAFHAAPAAGQALSVTCEFRYVCRFDSDTFDAKQFASGFHAADAVSLITTDFQ